MYLNLISHYLPQQIIRNDYFKNVNGLSDEWILSRTGIKERRKALSHENTNTMAIDAVQKAIENLPYPISDIDLIVGATYTPYDTVVGLAHSIQNHFNINNAKAITITSACSSFVNAVEIVSGYFAMNKAENALVIASEHKTAYSNEKDEQSGHLWGDGAAVFFITKKKKSNSDIKIIDVITESLGNISKASEAVYLRPLNGGIKMPFGKDVFINANNYMVSVLTEILNKNNLSINDLSYVIPHQANIRIIEHIRKELNLNEDKMVVNIDKLGNTGCASTPIAFSQNQEKFKKDDLIGITVFGGGYSSGAILMKK
ncbi:MAG: ketoacyl-ACP synthase III [Bacteroidetes bacterium]|nr:MAG: ketoacyl-ACP synthase III [Bacteroidota bacterium]